MPLIRYDLGDIGVPKEGQCRCGRGLPLMELIQGRADNFITLPSGAIVPPVGTFGEIIGAEPAVVEYLVVQEDYDLIVVELVLAGKAGAEVLARVRGRIEDLLRHEATVRVEAVDRIDRGVQPKVRAILSRVPVPFSGPKPAGSSCTLSRETIVWVSARPLPPPSTAVPSSDPLVRDRRLGRGPRQEAKPAPSRPIALV